MPYLLSDSAARRLREIFASSNGISRRNNSRVAAVSPEAFARPFEVQWAQSINNNSGAWLIWLPVSRLVIVNGQSLDPSEDLSPAGSDYPSGWYILDDSQLSYTDGGTLYLEIIPAADSDSSDDSSDDSGGVSPDSDSPTSLAPTSPTSSPAASIAFSASETPSASNGIVIPVCVATVNSSTGARSIKQLLCSPIVLGDGVYRTLTYINADGEEQEIQIIASDDIVLPQGVRSINSLDGDLDIIGGSHIIVTNNGRATIKISYDPDKEEEDEDPNPEERNPCTHPQGGNPGVSPTEDLGSSGVSGEATTTAGGVSASGDTHLGNTDCCSPKS